MTENTNQTPLDIMEKEYRIRSQVQSNSGEARSASNEIIIEADRTGLNVTKMIGGGAVTAYSGIKWHQWGKARANCMRTQAQLADDFIKQANEMAKIGKFDPNLAKAYQTQQEVIANLEAEYRTASIAKKPRLAGLIKKARASLHTDILNSGLAEVERGAMTGLDDVTKSFVKGMAEAGDDAARLAALRGYASSNKVAQGIVANADDVAKNATAMKQALAARKGISAQTRASINAYLDDVIKNPTSFNPAKLTEIAVDGSGKSLLTGQMKAPFEAASESVKKLATFSDDVAKLYGPYQNIGKLDDVAKGFSQVTDIINGSGYKATSKALSPALKGEVELLKHVDDIIANNAVKLGSKATALSKMTSFVGKATARGLPIAGIALGAGLALSGASDQFGGFDLDSEEAVEQMLETLKKSPDIEFKEDTYTQEQKKAMIDWALANTNDATQKEILNGIKDNGYDYAKYLISTGDLYADHQESNEWAKELNKLIQSTANAEFYTMLDESKKELEGIRQAQAEHEAAENAPDTNDGNTDDRTNTDATNTAGTTNTDATNTAGTTNTDATNTAGTTNTDATNTAGTTNTDATNTAGTTNTDATNTAGTTNTDATNTAGTTNTDGTPKSTSTPSKTLGEHGQKINPDGIKFVPTVIKTDDLINSL